MNEQHPAEVECPCCNGVGCKDCDGGSYVVSTCPSQYIGSELISDIQVVSASEYHLPIAGGLLDQSAWWFELRQLLKSEESLIQSEQMRRRGI